MKLFSALTLSAIFLSTCAEDKKYAIQKPNFKMTLLKLDSTYMNRLPKACSIGGWHLYDTNGDVIGLVGIIIENNKYDTVYTSKSFYICKELLVGVSSGSSEYRKIGRFDNYDGYMGDVSKSILKGNTDTILIYTTFAEKSERIDSLIENHTLYTINKDTISEHISYRLFYSKQHGIELRMK